MTLEEFAELVRQMREAQKRFFKGDRSAHLVGRAKALERQVDDAVETITRPALFPVEDRP